MAKTGLWQLCVGSVSYGAPTESILYEYLHFQDVSVYLTNPETLPLEDTSCFLCSRHNGAASKVTKASLKLYTFCRKAITYAKIAFSSYSEERSAATAQSFANVSKLYIELLCMCFFVLSAGYF